MAKINSYNGDIEQIFKNDLPWDKLSGCNILVTGATGLIGGCFVDALLMNPARNYHVYASGRNVERARLRFKRHEHDKSFHFIPYDVLDPMKGHINYDYIIHAASNASPNFFVKKPVEVIKSNIYGVANLIEYGLSHGMKRFLYISTGEIYGEGDGRVLAEDYSGFVNCAVPRSCYPSSKRAAETLCVSFSVEYGADVVIARPCHTYGPYFTDSDNRVYAQFIRNVLNGEDIIMNSDGSQLRSWCYVVDCVSALLYILLKGSNGEAYNIADSNSTVTIKSLAELIAEISHRKVECRKPSNEESLGKNPVTKSIFSIQKIENLGWRINGSMKDKMEATIFCHKEYRDSLCQKLDI